MVVSSRLRDATGVRAGVEQREAAGAVGRLHHAGREAALPDGRRLLVAGDAENADRRRRTGRARWRRSPPAQSRTSGSMRGGTPNSLHRVRRPTAPRADVEQQRARGIGGVGRVHLAAGQPPQQKAVDRAEGEPARPRPRRARRRHGRAARRSWSRRNTDRAAGRSCRRSPARGRRRASCAQESAVRRSCQTMALWIGLPVGAIPDDRGLALVGDADAGDVLGARRRPSPSRRARSRPPPTRFPPDRARPSRAPDRSGATPAARSATRRRASRRTRWRASRWCPDRWR